MNNYVTRLEGFGILEITGEDAPSFLQAQFTSNINELMDQESRFSAWCNAQGRVICTLLVIRSQDRYLLLLPREMVQTICQRLKMFILRAKVSITDRSLHYIGVGFLGDQAEAIADQISIISEPFVKTTIRISTSQRIILLLPTDQLAAFTSRLADATYSLTDECAWQLADIQDGIPWITPPISGELMPAELNLERLGGLSYNKGCYPGQEIIARLHFRGKLKRRLCQAYIDSQHPVLSAGARLHTGAEPVLAGIVIVCVQDSGHRMRLLAVIDTEITGTGTVFSEYKETVQFIPLPEPLNTG